MTRIITLRLSDEAYDAVKRYAESDHQSMNSWVESVLDAEERFCVDLGEGQWAVMGLVTFIAKVSLTEYHRKVDVQTPTNMFKILATPKC